MPVFIYRAKDRKGRNVRGQIEAENEKMALAQLRSQGYYVTKLSRRGAVFADLAATHEIALPARRSTTARRPSPRRSWMPSLDILTSTKIAALQLFQPRKLPLREISLFCRQLATILASGMPIMTGLLALQEQAASRKLKAAIAQVCALLETGSTFAEALERTKMFPAIMVHMVEAGEVGGILDQVLDNLARHFDREYQLQQKLRSAMTYPSVVLIVACIVVFVMLGYVVPRFVMIFKDIGAELPLPTLLMIRLSEFLRTSWYVLLAALIGLAIGVNRALHTRGGRRFFDSLALRVPIIKDLTTKLALARFGNTLGALLQSGVPILQAVSVTGSATGNLLMAEALERVRKGVERGSTLSAELRNEPIFPPMIREMAAVGEETGALEKMLFKVAEFYESEVARISERLSSMVEPILILFLGGIVGSIVISIMLPMFEMYTKIQR